MRIRTVKPEFFLHEQLYEAERASRLPCRLAFIGLWCAADREGRFKWEPRRLGIQVLPYDNVDFSRVLDALTTRGFVVKYASGTDFYGVIPSFKRHQVINNKERASELPEFEVDGPESASDNDSNACPTRDEREDDACPTPLNPDQVEGKGREGNKEQGKERNIGDFDLGGTDSPKTSRKIEETDPVKLRLFALFNRRKTRRMDDKELAAFKKADIQDEDLAAVEEWWNDDHHEWEPPNDYRRRDLLTLLNNWSKDVDRAESWKAFPPLPKAAPPIFAKS